MPILHQKILTYIQKAQYIDENTLIQYILTLEPIDSLQAKDVIQTLLQKNLLEESNLYTYRSTEPTRIYLIKHIIV